MGRCHRYSGALIALIAFTLLAGCGYKNTGPLRPASVRLGFGSTNLEVGGSTSAIPAAIAGGGNAIPNLDYTFSISNPSALSIVKVSVGTASQYFVCAGVWDSATLPTTCNPGGGVGQVIVTATETVSGVSSPPLLVFVHQHIDRLTVAPLTPPACTSKDHTQIFEATALSNGQDITSTVGPIDWRTANTTIASASTTATGLQPNQAQVTARLPGLTQISASVGGTSSAAVDFGVCAVQSIRLALSSGASNSIRLNKGGSAAITSTVVDTAGVTLAGVPLTFTSTHPTAASVSAAGTISAVNPGGAGISASCTPPSCNGGYLPTQTIYSPDTISVTVNGTNNLTTAYVTSTSCGATDGCATSLFPIALNTNLPGTAIPLPHTPNSIALSTGTGATASRIFLGSSFGLMVVETAGKGTVSTNIQFPGRVLTISPDGAKLIIADDSTTPNRLFAYDVASGTAVQFIANGVTRAQFSPDSSQAYILSHVEPGGPFDTLFIYSRTQSFQAHSLSIQAKDLTFHPDGAFAYLAGGVPGVDFFDTCNNVAHGSVDPGGTPAFLRALSDGTIASVLPPGIALFSSTPLPNPGASCPLLISNGAPQFFDLGQGDFTPTRFFVSSDARSAYVLTDSLPSVLRLRVDTQNRSGIALTGSPLPLEAGLTTDGSAMYVGATDGLVHRLDLSLGLDAQQIALTSSCSASNNTTAACLCSGNAPPSIPGRAACVPDLVAVKP